MASTRKAKITSILRRYYGKGSMVTALGEELDKKYDTYEVTERRDELQNAIWMWFSGGDTAQAAADEIRKALS